MDETRRQERIKALGDCLPAELRATSEADRLHALLEVAFLTAVADGKLDEAEIHNLAANLQSWLDTPLAPGFLVGLFDDLAGHLAGEGFAARLTAAAGALPDDESRRIAFKLACVTALVDMEVHDDELGILGKIADALSIPEAEAQATFDELDDMVSSLAGA